MTAGADQRTAAVAGIDRGVGLDVRHPLAFADVGIGAPDSTDDSSCHGVVQAKGVADGNRPLTGPELVGIAQAGHRQVVGHHLHHSHIGEGVSAEHFAFELPAIGQGDGHPIGALHHVFIGEDQAVGTGDEADPWPLLALGRWTKTQDPPQGIAHLFHGVDADHRRSDPFHGADDHIFTACSGAWRGWSTTGGALSGVPHHAGPGPGRGRRTTGW